MKFQHCFVLIFLAFAKAQDDSRVVGGVNSNILDNGHHASLRNSAGAHFCGGGIIAEKFILTAAHCGCPAYVTVGLNTLTPAGTRYDVRACYPHPSYNSATIRHDIELVNTINPIVYKDYVHPISLLKDFDIWDNAFVWLEGWGYTSVSGPVANVMQVLRTKIIPFSQCLISWPGVVNSDQDLCALTVSGQGACFGDSGSILSLNRKFAVGIVSRGRPCAVGMPDIYTSVRRYVDWIEWTMFIYRYP